MKRSDETEATRLAQESVSGEKSWMIASRVFRSRRVAKLQEIEKMKLKATFRGRLIERLEEDGLGREALKEKIGVDFERLHAETLTDKLKSARVPYQSAMFNMLQLNPENWKQYGNSFRRYKSVAVDVGKPLWRFRYAILLFWSTLKWCVGGSCHFLLSGPLSMRALLSENPYYAISRPSVDPSTRTSTLRSRLKAMFDSLTDRKRRFESEPDTGIIPKTVSRFLLSIQIFVEGCVKATSIVFFMSCGVILSSVVCLLWLSGSPVFALLWTAVVLTFQLLFVDTVLMKSSSKRVGTRTFFKKSPKFYVAAPVVKLVLFAPFLIALGTAELALAGIRVALLHPVLLMARLVAGSARLLYRSVRDFCTWPVLRRFAMVPATSEDTWLAKRVSGPGVSSQFYNRLPAEAAQAAVLRSLECDRLSAHQLMRDREMDAPYNHFIAMFDASDFGIRTTGVCLSPSAAVRARNTITDRQNTRKAPLRGLDTQNEWETLASNIRLAEAGNRAHLQRYRAELQEERERELEQRFKNFSYRPLKSNAQQVSSNSPLGLLVNHTFVPLSNFRLHVTSLQKLLTEMIEVPASARGSFRMTEDEIEDLWQFTITAVEEFQKLLKAELVRVASESQWLVEKDIEFLVVDFATKSIAVEALRILSSILGEQSLTESLEDLDASFVFDKGNHITLEHVRSLEI